MIQLQKTLCRSSDASEGNGSAISPDISTRALAPLVAAGSNTIKAVHNEMWAHCSNSGSIIDVMRVGLKSIAQLAREGTVPFSGEISTRYAATSQIRECISFAALNAIPGIIKDYSLSTLTKHRGADFFADQVRIFERGLISKDASLQEFYDHDALKELLRVNRGRLSRFDKLSALQKSFVTDPFPVMYAIEFNPQQDKQHNFHVNVRSHVGAAEIGIRHPIARESLTVVVPALAIERVTRYSKELDQSCELITFNALGKNIENIALMYRDSPVNPDDVKAQLKAEHVHQAEGYTKSIIKHHQKIAEKLFASAQSLYRAEQYQ